VHAPGRSIDGTVALILEEQRRIDLFITRKVVPVPPATKVMMVGPHPDDNLFGPGATAIKYVDARIPVFWVCLTDGRACAKDSAERERMGRLRGAEETACARSLGIPDPELYGIPEHRLTDAALQSGIVERLRATFARESPDAVFTPYFLENHPLHRYTNHLVALALKSHPRDCMVYSWAVASFPPPSYVVDTTAVFHRKLEACWCYKTQMDSLDYREQLTVLSQLQAVYAPGALHADVFFALPKGEYVEESLSRCLDRQETLGAGAQPVNPEP